MTERERALFALVNALVEAHVYRLPTDIARLCEIYGVRRVSFGEYGPERAAGVAGNRDGAAVETPEGRWGILYNERAPALRLRFTLGEELMHLMLGHAADPDFIFARQSWTSETYARYETEARLAAGMLLVPPSVYYRLRGRCAPEAIARACAVSNACVHTAARIYDAREEEIRAAFTGKYILCAAAPRKRRGIDA